MLHMAYHVHFNIDDDIIGLQKTMKCIKGVDRFIDKCRPIQRIHSLGIMRYEFRFSVKVVWPNDSKSSIR